MPSVCAGSSANDKYPNIKKLWAEFCHFAGWPAERARNPCFIDDRNQFRDGWFRQFFLWLYEEKQLVSHKQNAKKASAWCYGKLSEECGRRLLPSPPAGYLGRLAGVGEIIKAVMDNAKINHLEAQVDWACEVDGSITPEEMLKLVYRHFKDLYCKCGVLCDKALHQGRVTGQQEMDDEFVDIDQIKRMCNYLHGM